jgi:uncharacterized membrane protein
MNKLNKTPLIVSIVMLFLAILPMPYGYYMLIRLVVCGTAIYVAYYAKQVNREKWMWAMGFIALLFNPLILIPLDRATWSLVDLAVAILFIVSLVKIKNGKQGH